MIISVFLLIWFSPLEQFDESGGWFASLLPIFFICLGLDSDTDDVSLLLPDNVEEINNTFALEESFEEQLLENNVGYDGPVVELLGAIFNAFLLINILGLTPGVGTQSAQIQYVLPLAILCFSFVIGTGIYYRGIAYLSAFFPAGVPVLLAPMLVPIEVLSYFARPFSLGIRMFANMMAGHALIVILFAFFFLAISLFGGAGFLIGLFPAIIIIAVCVLELAVAFLQAYVFTVLLSIYFREIVEGH